MLVWTRAEGEEKFDRDAFVAHFDLASISLAGAVFDTGKLAWLNGRYLREDYDAAGIARLLRGWRFDDRTLEAAARLAQPRMRTLGDFGPLASPFFADEVAPDLEALAGGVLPATVAEWLLLAEWAVEDLDAFTEESVREALRGVADSLEVRLRKFTKPLYLAVSGSAVSTPLFGSMVLLGSSMTRMRLRRARAALGGVPRRREKELAARRGSPRAPPRGAANRLTRGLGARPTSSTGCQVRPLEGGGDIEVHGDSGVAVEDRRHPADQDETDFRFIERREDPVRIERSFGSALGHPSFSCIRRRPRRTNRAARVASASRSAGVRPRA